MADVYFSVCPAGIGDIKTGSPTITISSGVATLSVAQTGNIGIGVEIDYDTDNKKAYISDCTSSTVFDLVTAVGGAPGDVTDKTVNSIHHVWLSMSAAEAAYLGANYVNDTDLTAAGAGIIAHLCGYGPTADTTKLTVSGATTDSTHYLEIMAPRGLATGEALTSNRHEGVWSTSAYRLEITDNTDCLHIDDEYVQLTGIQLESKGTGGYINIIDLKTPDNFKIDYLILKDTDAGAAEKHYGVTFATSDASTGSWIRNSIIYNTTAEAIRGGGLDSSYGFLIANCTIYNSGRGRTEDGIEIDYRSGKMINTLVWGSSSKDIVVGGFDGGSSTSSNNFTEDTYGNDFGTNSHTNVDDGYTPDFVLTTWGSEDFRLQSSSDMRGEGVGPDGDGDCTTLDAAGNTRSGATCDIGALQYVAAAGGLSIPVAIHHYMMAGGL